MISSLSVVTAHIVGTSCLKSQSEKGVVENKLPGGLYRISLSTGQMTVQVSQGTLSAGDQVAVSVDGQNIRIVKIPAEDESGADRLVDTVDVASETDVALLKLLSQAVTEQLQRTVTDKTLLVQVQKIVDVMAKNPQVFPEDVQQEILQLQSLASTVSNAEDMSPLSDKISGRLFGLVQKIMQTIQNNSADISISLKQNSEITEGFIRFDTLQKAIEWVVDKKDVAADLPWKKLTETYGNGPVVAKVYQTPVDMRLSFIPAERCAGELDHFIKTNLRSTIWRDVPVAVIGKVLTNNNVVSVKQLTDLDDTLVSAFPANTVAEPAGETNLPVVGNANIFQSSFEQWLSSTLSLDNSELVREFVMRMPLPVPQTIPDLLSNIPDSARNDLQQLVKQIQTMTVGISTQQLTVADRQNVVANTFTQLGLNLESTLAALGKSGTEMPFNSNVKALLLQLSHDIESLIEQYKTETPESTKDVLAATGSDNMPRDGEVSHKATARQDAEMPSRSFADRPPVTIRETMLSKKETQPTDVPTNQMQKNDKSDLVGSLESVKAQVDKVLMRIESMQLLARQIQTNEGAQQVVCLPLNIDGNWSDVIMKFRKKNGKEKNGSGQSVSIAVHVAPGLLGAISVYMDYSAKKQFAMRMEFEKPQAKTWFEQHREPFNTAMNALGLSVFKIDIRDMNVLRPAVSGFHDEADFLFAGKIDVHA